MWPLLVAAYCTPVLILLAGVMQTHPPAVYPVLHFMGTVALENFARGLTAMLAHTISVLLRPQYLSSSFLSAFPLHIVQDFVEVRLE